MEEAAAAAEAPPRPPTPPLARGAPALDLGEEPIIGEHDEAPLPPPPVFPPSELQEEQGSSAEAEEMAAAAPAAGEAGEGVEEEGAEEGTQQSPASQAPEETLKEEEGGAQPPSPAAPQHQTSEIPGEAGLGEEEDEAEELTQQSPTSQPPGGPLMGEVGGKQPPSPTPAQQQTSEEPQEPAEGEAGAPPPSPPRPSEEEAEALRLKSLAEEKYRTGAPLKSALKHAKRALRLVPDLDGLPQMVTALRVLRAPPGDHYRALLLEPFSHVNTVRQQYKALALALHPDKNAASLSAFPGSEEAFKRVGEAFQVLSDRARRREYDLRLRVELEAAAERGRAEEAGATRVETFWTACTTCRLFHQFDRRYVGQRLLCPRCKKSFQAVEVRTDGSEEGEDRGGKGSAAATNSRARATRSARSARTSISPSTSRVPTISRAPRSPRPVRPSRLASRFGVPASQEVAMQRKRKRKVNIGGPSEEPIPKSAKEKTLAEMQLELKRKSRSKSVSPKAKEKEKGRDRALVPTRSTARDLRAMAVEDSDFYDFDKHRTEKSFRKGQIWAIYDDDDGMPRHYGLIDEVFSTHPFRVKMSWLDVQSNGDEALLMWEKHGLHISCGRFRVGRTVDIDSVNFFSHLVECEQAAKELYRIYPKKGSLWALYSEGNPDGGEERRYDIVVLLTSYSEMYGLSMAYLVKVEGYKTIFKRREIGVHAIKWLEKDDTRVFSHQIPARKLSGSEGLDLPSECWELDPASLPPDLLQIDWKA
ncbi:hypothetical protein Taro_025181 [Colocasia esculenta]|uniref:J domain-containing protein n=1 Tax=Colocasia esculenta TaxID=4460 RepID=A0A843VJS3_COLES|nr:hypothetical protein [Colocasia esculenta]